MNALLLKGFDILPQIEEIELLVGENIFDQIQFWSRFTWYSCVCIFHEDNGEDSDDSEVNISSAGNDIPYSMRLYSFLALDKHSNINVVSFLNVGRIFGFVDFKLFRHRMFCAASL